MNDEIKRREGEVQNMSLVLSISSFKSCKVLRLTYNSYLLYEITLFQFQMWFGTSLKI